MRPTIPHLPLDRAMWQHRFSQFSTAEVRRGVEQRSTAFAPTSMLENSKALEEIKGMRITGLQKEGIGAESSIADQSLEIDRVMAVNVQYPIRDVLDFRSGEQLLGTYQLGSDMNDFVASEYGQTLGADPFRDPRQIMLDQLREQQYPDVALSRQDLANRFFLAHTTQTGAAQQALNQPELIRQEQQAFVADQTAALDALRRRLDSAGTVPQYARSQASQRQQFAEEERSLSVANVSSRMGSNSQGRSSRDGSAPSSFQTPPDAVSSVTASRTYMTPSNGTMSFATRNSASSRGSANGDSVSALSDPTFRSYHSGYSVSDSISSQSSFPASYRSSNSAASHRAGSSTSSSASGSISSQSAFPASYRADVSGYRTGDSDLSFRTGDSEAPRYVLARQRKAAREREAARKRRSIAPTAVTHAFDTYSGSSSIRRRPTQRRRYNSSSSAKSSSTRSSMSSARSRFFYERVPFNGQSTQVGNVTNVPTPEFDYPRVRKHPLPRPTDGRFVILDSQAHIAKRSDQRGRNRR